MNLLRFHALFLAVFPAILSAQQDAGIRFENALNWNLVREQAKAENKFIFVDFYGTWCGPCKRMDKDVYTNKNVGEIANQHFISVKIQVDKTATDNDAIKNWYGDAENLSNIYHINTLPTLLCLTADGSLITKDEGFKSPDEFTAILNNALITSSGYSTSIEKYRQDELPPASLGQLAQQAKKIGDITLADSIAVDYKKKWLDRLSDTDLLTVKNMIFAREFSSILDSRDRIFRFFYKEPDSADRMLELDKSHPGMTITSSKDLAEYVVLKEEITDRIYQKDGRPSIENAKWKTIYRNIQEKYGKDYADELVPRAMISFYRATGDWLRYSTMINAAIKKFSPEVNGRRFANATMTGMMFQRDDWNLNTSAWDVFQHCDDKEVLKAALKWSVLSITIIDKKESGILDSYLDTKASLLYKLGRVKEAIDIETEAYNLVLNREKKAGKTGGGEDYLETINKMKEGLPTWPTKK